MKLPTLLLSICVATAGWSQTYSNVTVLSTDNLSGAGNSNTTPNPGGGSGGTAASSYALTAGSGRTLTFQSVSGDISLSHPHVRTLPDGIQADGSAPFGLSLNVSSFGGVSGIALDRGSGFLAGVFLDAGYPSSAPASLTFVNSMGSASGTNVGFTMLAPLIGQIFFIGDGRTGNGSGATQTFNVPNGATRLFLGIVDAGSYSGAPAQFQDNDGQFNASFQVVPEPTTLAAVALGVSLLARRRRQASN